MSQGRIPRCGYSLAAFASIRGGPFFCLVKNPPALGEIGESNDLCEPGESGDFSEDSGIVAAFCPVSSIQSPLRFLLTSWLRWCTDMVSHEGNLNLFTTCRTLQRREESRTSNGWHCVSVYLLLSLPAMSSASKTAGGGSRVVVCLISFSRFQRRIQGVWSASLLQI